MKKILLLSLLTAFYFNANSQTFSEVGTIWHNYHYMHYASGVPGGGTYHDTRNARIQYMGDEIVGLDTFQVFVRCETFTSSNPAVSGYQANDSLYVYQDAEQVYCGIPGDMHLYYDFTLAIGDSTKVNVLQSTDSVNVEVVDIDSVLINGTYRKRIIFEDFDPNHEGMQWVEGVGDPLYGVFRADYNLYFDAHYLSCMLVDGNAVSGTCANSHPTCPSEWLSVPTLTSQPVEDLQVYPNPFTNHITLNINSNYLLKIYDLSGKLLFQKVGLAGDNLVDLAFLNEGVYLLELDDYSTIRSLKIVK